jgi:hypothetical protein
VTFEQFQATRQHCDDLGAVLSDCSWDGEPAACGNLYLDCLYIDQVLPHWPEQVDPFFASYPAGGASGKNGCERVRFAIEVSTCEPSPVPVQSVARSSLRQRFHKAQRPSLGSFLRQRRE